MDIKNIRTYGEALRAIEQAISEPGGRDGPELVHLRTKVVTEEYIEHGLQSDSSKKMLPDTLAAQVRSVLAKKGFVTVVDQTGNA